MNIAAPGKGMALLKVSPQTLWANLDRKLRYLSIEKPWTGKLSTPKSGTDARCMHWSVFVNASRNLDIQGHV